MKRLMTVLMVMLFLAATPLIALGSGCCSTGKQPVANGKEMVVAMNHGDQGKTEDMKHMDHAKDKAHDMHAEHGGHGNMGGMQVIDEKTEDGVKGVAKIMAYDPKMAEMAGATHHLMVYFTDESGKPITQGKVAVKVKGHHGEAKPVELMAMGDGFGSDLKIDKGHYELEVGTKLEDGKKRKFEYDYNVD